MPVDAATFADALRQYAAGVCLLTVRDDIDDVGTTVTSVMSVSAQPPLIAVGLADGGQDLGGVAPRGEADRDQRRVRRDAHERADRRPDVVDVVPDRQEAHPGGVLTERGGEVGGVHWHGGQSTTPAG